mgnify:CR=1 FL=1
MTTPRFLPYLVTVIGFATSPLTGAIISDTFESYTSTHYTIVDDETPDGTPVFGFDNFEAQIIEPTEHRVADAFEIGQLSVNPGDTIILKNGEWVDQRFVLSFSGTEELPITVKAETPGRVLLTGDSQIQFDGSYIELSGIVFYGESPIKYYHAVEFLSSSSFCRLTSSAIIDYNPTERPAIDNHHWVNIWGTNNRVDHCLFKGKKQKGPTLRVRRDENQNDHHRIDNNYFLDRPELGQNGGETIQIGLKGTQTTDSLTIVERNLFEKLNGEIEIISVKSGGNILRHNTVRNSAGLFTLRHGNGNTIDGNFFFCNLVGGAGGVRMYGQNHKILNNYVYGARSTSTARGGISIHSGDHTDPLFDEGSTTIAAENCLVAFNTLVNCQQSLSYGNEKPFHPKDITLANNIISTSVAPIIMVRDEIIDPIYEGNMFFGATLGITQPTGVELIEAGLIQDEHGVYRVDEDSNAVNAAVGDYPEVLLDLDGQVRDDGALDVGADEYSTSAVTNRPLYPDDVGPDWIESPYTLPDFTDPPKPPKPPEPILYFLESGGSVTMEAENFSESVAGAHGTWGVIADANASGPASDNAIEMPVNASRLDPGDGARIDYDVFLSQSGSYYIHLLGFGPDTGSNSVYVSVNGDVPNSQTVSVETSGYLWKKSSSAYLLSRSGLPHIPLRSRPSL